MNKRSKVREMFNKQKAMAIQNRYTKAKTEKEESEALADYIALVQELGYDPLA